MPSDTLSLSVCLSVCLSIEKQHKRGTPPPLAPPKLTQKYPGDVESETCDWMTWSHGWTAHSHAAARSGSSPGV